MASSYRSALGVTLAALGGAVLLPAACLFPSYSFDLQAGGSGSTSSTSGTTSATTSMSSTNSTSSTSSTTGPGGGGSGGMTGSTTSSTSSTGTCATADCSDPDCQSAYSCVSPPPSGWQGHFALYDGPAASSPGCSGVYPTSAFLGNGGFSATPATCSQCTCAAPQGEKCNMPATIESADSTCGNVNTCGADLPTDWAVPCVVSMQSPYLPGQQNFCGPSAVDCTTGSFAPCNVSLTVGPTTVTSGSCTASSVTPTKPAPTWQSLGEACGEPTPGTGCNGSQVCLPKPASGFAPNVCIMKAGDQACPPGPFQEQHVFHTGFTDSRDCTACSCGASAGASCSATVTVYGVNTGCNGAAVATINTNTAAGACANLAGNPMVGSRKAVTTAPTGGACPASGGQPLGAAAPDAATAVTFCCIP